MLLAKASDMPGGKARMVPLTGAVRYPRFSSGLGGTPLANSEIGVQLRRPMRPFIAALVCLASSSVAAAQARARPTAPVTTTLLVPDRVWDGVEAAPHSGWAVLVTGNKIVAAGPLSQINAPSGATTIDLPGTTLMPGLIDAHSHVLLHPYNETSWNDQVLHDEPSPSPRWAAPACHRVRGV